MNKKLRNYFMLIIILLLKRFMRLHIILMKLVVISIYSSIWKNKIVICIGMRQISQWNLISLKWFQSTLLRTMKMILEIWLVKRILLLKNLRMYAPIFIGLNLIRSNWNLRWQMKFIIIVLLYVIANSME